MNIHKRNRMLQCVVFAAGLTIMLSLVSAPLYAQTAGKAGRQIRSEKEGKMADIRRMKNKTIVSRSLADRIQEDNGIALSTVAIQVKQLPNNDSAFKVVQIDKGGIADRLGFKAGDIIWKVNGLDMNAARDQVQTLEQSDRFEVLLLRGGKKRILRFEIR